LPTHGTVVGVARDLPAEVVGEKVDDAADVAGADALVELATVARVCCVTGVS